MRSLLLVSIDVWLPLLIFFIIILFAIGILITLKTKFGKDKGMVTKNEPKVMNLIKTDEYISKNEVLFLKNLSKVLPDDFIAYPRVGVDNIVQPKGDKLAYNTILSQYVDVCIFLKNCMEPVLVVDIYEANTTDVHLKHLSPNVYKAMSTVNIPIVKIMIQEEYDLEKLRCSIIEAMPAKVVALIKENMKVRAHGE